jgi:carbon storage regulator
MLVLTRRIGEDTLIGDEVRVTVLAIKGRQVRIGITAPTSIRVVRMEVLTRAIADGTAVKEIAHEQAVKPHA